MRQRIVEFFATGLYLGKIKFAPGTFGTLLGIPVAWAMATYLPMFGYLVGLVLLVVLSSVCAHFHEKFTGLHDPGEIVIDEVVGYAVAMTWLPLTWQTFAIAFVVFRIFDILKPPPIQQIDDKVPGGFGTTLDDVVSGLVTNGVMQLLLHQTTWLGGVYAS